MTESSDSIREFWLLFQQRALALAAAESADDPVYDELLDKLHEIDPGLYLEFSTEPVAHELIVTADGDRSRFDLARRVVASAPAIAGWSIRALKPRSGFPETVQWENLTLRTAGIMFRPVEREGSNELDLHIFVPGITKEELEAAHNAVLRAMDHGLGEQTLAEAVQHPEVHPYTQDPRAEALWPLVELYEFIQRREGRVGRDAG